MNLFDIFMRGGVIMYLIVLCLIVMVYCTIERWLTLRTAQIDVGQFVVKIRNTFQSGGIDAVLTFCAQRGTPIANIIRHGALKHDHGIERVRDAIEDASREEVYRLEKRLPVLESIAKVAPMLGLLGAMIGIANTFLRIESLGRGASQGDVVDSILVALVEAGFGLAVGIPSYVFYAYFRARVARLLHEMGVASAEFLELLQQQRVVEKPLPVQVGSRPASYNPKPATTLVFDDDLYFRKKR
jgi:biopolymer transport protein ExbB